MNYEVQISRPAQKQLAGIGLQDRNRIYSVIRALANDPRPVGCIKLTDRNAWRIRVGDYRIIYEICDDRLCIIVIKVGHRRDIYQ